MKNEQARRIAELKKESDSNYEVASAAQSRIAELERRLKDWKDAALSSGDWVSLDTGKPARPATETGDARKLQMLADHFQYWLDYCDRDGVTDETHIMVPPSWPSRGTLKEWIRILRQSLPPQVETRGGLTEKEFRAIFMKTSIPQRIIDEIGIEPKDWLEFARAVQAFERASVPPVATPINGYCDCIPLAPRPYLFCQNCGGRIKQSVETGGGHHD